MLVYYHDWYVSTTQAQHNLDIVNNIGLKFSVEETNKKKKGASDGQLSTGSGSDGSGGEEEVLDCVGYTSVAMQRNIDPRLLHANAGCTNRLNAFIYRELDAIALLASALSSSSSSFSTAFRNITSSQTKARNATWLIETAKRVRLDSDEFAAELRKIVRPARYARHMQHELTASRVQRRVADRVCRTIPQSQDGHNNQSSGAIVVFVIFVFAECEFDTQPSSSTCNQSFERDDTRSLTRKFVLIVATDATRFHLLMLLVSLPLCLLKQRVAVCRRRSRVVMVI